MKKGKKHQKLSTVGLSFDLNVSSQGVNKNNWCLKFAFKIAGGRGVLAILDVSKKEMFRQVMILSPMYLLYPYWNEQSSADTLPA